MPSLPRTSPAGRAAFPESLPIAFPAAPSTFLPPRLLYAIFVTAAPAIVYPRTFEGEKKDHEYLQHENISLVNAPIIELSATEIRNMIKEGKNVRPMLPPEVFEYLDGSSFYK